MMISFGPYHYDKPHLQAMEKHKWRYLRDFLSRSTHGATLGGCLLKMKDWEKEARNCYNESIEHLTSEQFVQMMLLDACFIIELAFKCYSQECIHFCWGVECLWLDLLLIENQIPFFIIKRLFDLVRGTTDLLLEPSLMELIRCLYLMAHAFKEPSPLLPPPAEILHLLHLYYYWFVASVNTVPNRRSPLRGVICLLFSCFSSRRCHEIQEEENATACVIPCATELSQAGVRFKKKRVPSHLLDITFQEGVMEIPVFSIEDSTKPLFTNLIAFEQSIHSGQRKMTSFCVLMDNLINTEKDVAILQRCDVIKNWLGSEEELTRFFNQLGQYVTYEKSHYFSEVFKQVNHYRNSKWHNYRARLVQDYFSNPWAFLSLVAGIVLLLLTFLQTFFALYTYFRPPR